MTNRMLWSLVPLILPLAVGCISSGDESEREVDPLSQPAGLCQAWAEGACSDRVWQACAAKDKMSCVSAQQSYCQSLLAEQGLFGPFPVAKSKACLRAVQEAFSDGKLTASERDTVQALGGACAELTGQAGDTSSGALRSGGQSCTPGVDECVAGFYCRAAASGAYCLERPGEGDPCCETADCDPIVPCQEAFLCTEDGGAQTCVARKLQGEACTRDAECAADLYCSGAPTGLCASELILAPSEPFCSNLR